MRSKDTVRVGSGAGTSDDRMLPALELAERGDIDYLVFECLAERTVSRENLSRSKDPNQGYAPSLHARLRMVLPTWAAWKFGWGLYWAWGFISAYVIALGFTFLLRFQAGKWKSMRVIERSGADDGAVRSTIAEDMPGPEPALDELSLQKAPE